MNEFNYYYCYDIYHAYLRTYVTCHFSRRSLTLFTLLQASLILALFRQAMINLTSIFRRKLGLIKWLIPLGLVLLVIAYEVGPSRWVYDSLGFTFHLVAEIFLFGTVGPVLVFLLLEMLSRWIEEKETADFQANLLAKAKQKDREVRQFKDDTIQVLFATSLLIANIKSDGSNLPPNTIAQIEVTEKALNKSIEHLRFNLLG